MGRGCGVAVRVISASDPGQNSAAGATFLAWAGKPTLPHSAIAIESRREINMSLRHAVVLATIVATAALGACRKEVPHKPMKLGGDVPAHEQVKR
jgi:hypothetical protein